jgi:hypothetical protein
MHHAFIVWASSGMNRYIPPDVSYAGLMSDGRDLCGTGVADATC